MVQNFSGPADSVKSMCIIKKKGHGGSLGAFGQC